MKILMHAEHLYDEGNYGEAHDLCIAVLQQEPESAAAFNLKGLCLESLGRIEEALGAFRMASIHFPVYAPIRFNLAKSLENCGDLEEAMKEYGQVLLLDSGHLSARLRRGAIRIYLGDMPGGKRDFDYAVRLYPEVAQCYAMRGGCLLNMKDFRAAYDDFRRALDLDPDMSEGIEWLIEQTIGPLEEVLKKE